MHHRARTAATGTCALMLPLVLALTACSVDDSTVGSSSDSGKPKPSASVAVALAPPDAALRARVPKQYAGKDVVMGVSEYAPYITFGSGGGITGLVPDLNKQLSSMLGIRITLRKTTFDSTIPGIKSGRIDLSSPVGDFVERQTEVDMTDFAQSNVTVMVAAQASFRPKTGTDLCGRKVGVEKGAGTQNVVAALTQRCEKAGKSAVNDQVFTDLPAAALALQSGRIDAVAAPSAANTAASESSGGRFKTVEIKDMLDLPAATAIYGIVSKKDSGLAPVLADALRKLHDEGTYQKLFDKWDLPLSTVDKAKIQVNGSKQSQTA
ncbi:transporter substrate-binding domain-containing protein [Streptomyces sp. HC44]|uniref:Transporter substrate-binding domain-containing protein n=1 Tax=Streptomyces scabichelini TaxID=2711217 RepID=A0A6G4V4M6_9ACTN|nr:transporter substrate-binding domain-containing protein [Streptomyces scabichelini]NGO08966.1 transporter substrate-binding domain-containing protein [Streptomyces scabichelini]